MAKRTQKKRKKMNSKKNQSFIKDEIFLLFILAISILLLISNFGMGGIVGKTVSGVLFGLFGILSYAFPVVLFLSCAFGISNRENKVAVIKLIAVILLFLSLCTFMQLASGFISGSIIKNYNFSSANRMGGGAFGGVLANILSNAFGIIGTYVITVILIIISVVLLTEKSFLGGVKKSSAKVYSSARDDAIRRRERNAVRREEKLGRRENKRANKKVTGVAFNTKLSKPEKINSTRSGDLKEITIDETEEDVFEDNIKIEGLENFANDSIEGIDYAKLEEELSFKEAVEVKKEEPKLYENSNVVSERGQVKTQRAKSQRTENNEQENVSESVKNANFGINANYRFPSYDLLSKPSGKQLGDSDKSLRETALKLQKTLQNFGVKVTVTNVSRGPAVTRYELQPEQGVKVSKIVSLSDDIKLNLAAADIRIEAPIPGKAAVGIEVPNKENVTVSFRELIESDEFKKHPSKLAFAAGKDISGQVIVADIARMPHLLIAGATGSGKSVCINTLIMSILYKAHPDDVKLIMIDPKVVELSVYNGIPHLFIPVVTDPKKASGALHWAVSEMTDRYQKFANLNVRDLKGYNAKVESVKDLEGENKPEKLPQIVIIVDELADLMMVAPGEVEDAICRLAQLARAAGIHLIIATQRPSVNVITGLIKANMPSRIAFAVSQGVDSRTIIDMNGAEKLLGKGDMLFYPQGYPKPQRVQGAFVSDKEVGQVVEFLKEQNTSVSYNSEIEEKMNVVQTNSGGMSESTNERDDYFVNAGRFIIEKDKASIGMLQRMFKIGFNRAARIMDQLADAGVVGEEEGTKPRKVLMSMEEFELYIDEYL